MDYWLVTTGDSPEPGINGAIGPSSDNMTTVNTVRVPSVDDFAAKIVKAGGKGYLPEDGHPGDGLLRLLPEHRGEPLRHYGERPFGEMKTKQEIWKMLKEVASFKR
jgi:hypothetical protein